MAGRTSATGQLHQLQLLLLVAGLCVVADSGASKTSREENALQILLNHMRKPSEFGPDLPMVYGDYAPDYDSYDNSLMQRVRKGAGNCYAQGKCLYYSKRLKTEFCGNCGTRQKCFPEDATVSLESGRRLPMTHLKVGDKVMAGDRRSGELVYSEVVAWLDRQANTTAQYTRVTTENGRAVIMSPNHVIFVNRNGQLVSTFAGELKHGDMVKTVDHKTADRLVWSEVKSIDPVISTGAYVPLTTEGTVVVDGVMASCYASFDHDWAHTLSSPLRWFPHYFHGLTENSDGKRESVEALKLVGQWLFPEPDTRYRAGPDLSVIQLPMHVVAELASSV